MDSEKSRRRRRLRMLLFGCLFVLALGLFIYFVGLPLLNIVGHPVSFRMKIRSLGFRGILLFALMIAAQVISAVLPAGAFQFAAGYIYGALRGALFYDAVAAGTSALIYFFSHRLGAPLFEKLRKRIHNPKKESEGKSLLARLPSDRESQAVFSFLVYLIPGLPKDLAPYVLGVSQIPVWEFTLLCFAGRFPTIFLTAMSGNELGNERYGNVILFSILIVTLTLVGGLIYRKTVGKGDDSDNT